MNLRKIANPKYCFRSLDTSCIDKRMRSCTATISGRVVRMTAQENQSSAAEGSRPAEV
jgi:hypothetical protein